jgi:hypothetical protein
MPVTQKRTRPVSLEELWDYEAKHPVVFASPRALAEARLIAKLERVRRPRVQRNGAAHRRRQKAYR